MSNKMCLNDLSYPHRLFNDTIKLEILKIDDYDVDTCPYQSYPEKTISHLKNLKELTIPFYSEDGATVKPFGEMFLNLPNLRKLTIAPDTCHEDLGAGTFSNVPYLEELFYILLYTIYHPNWRL